MFSHMKARYYFAHLCVRRLAGNKDLPEEENIGDIQFPAVIPSGGDASSYVPKLL